MLPYRVTAYHSFPQCLRGLAAFSALPIPTQIYALLLIYS